MIFSKQAKTYSLFSILCLASACALFDRTYTVSERTEKYMFAPAWTDQRKARRADSSAEAKKNLYFVSAAENDGKRLCLKEAGKRAFLKAADETADEILRLLKEEKKKNNKVHIPSNMKERLRANILVNLFETKVAGEYWEKRLYMKEKGAEKDYSAYKCDVVVKVPKTVLAEAVKVCNEKISLTMKHNTRLALEAVMASYAEGLDIEN